MTSLEQWFTVQNFWNTEQTYWIDLHLRGINLTFNLILDGQTACHVIDLQFYISANALEIRALQSPHVERNLLIT
jgi:hypothetical protein